MAIILASITLLTALIFINRLTLSYNSEGKNFDENSFTIYDEQAIIAYGI